MAVEKYLFPVVLALAITVSYTQSVKVADTCRNSAECPLNSTCTQRGCDGKVCICDNGFSPLQDLTACKIAVNLDDSCAGDDKICKATNSLCAPDTRVCICQSAYIPASDNLRCKSKPMGPYQFALLGEPCDGQYKTCQGTFVRCDLELTNPKCSCWGGFRPATEEEKNAEPFIRMECRHSSYNLTLPRMELDCIQPDVDVYSDIDETCVSDNNCPDHSVCRPRGCDGKVCVCDTGYYPTADKKACLDAVDISGSCASNTTICKHEGLYTRCNKTSGLCECMEGFEADQGRCRPAPNVLTVKTVIRKVFLGESCRTVKAGDINYIFPCLDSLASCNTTTNICDCYTGLRKRNADEVALNPGADSECVPNDLNSVTNTDGCDSAPLNPAPTD